MENDTDRYGQSRGADVSVNGKGVGKGSLEETDKTYSDEWEKKRVQSMQ